MIKIKQCGSNLNPIQHFVVAMEFHMVKKVKVGRISHQISNDSSKLTLKAGTTNGKNLSKALDISNIRRLGRDMRQINLGATK